MPENTIRTNLIFNSLKFKPVSCFAYKCTKLQNWWLCRRKYQCGSFSEHTSAHWLCSKCRSHGVSRGTIPRDWDAAWLGWKHHPQLPSNVLGCNTMLRPHAGAMYSTVLVKWIWWKSLTIERCCFTYTPAPIGRKLLTSRQRVWCAGACVSAFHTRFHWDIPAWLVCAFGPFWPGELREAVRRAVLRSWSEAGVMEAAVQECRRLQVIAAEERGAGSTMKYDIAIQVLLSHNAEAPPGKWVCSQPVKDDVNDTPCTTIQDPGCVNHKSYIINYQLKTIVHLVLGSHIAGAISSSLRY